MAALSGPKAPGERPDIPERPDADREELEGEGMGLLSEDDEWGMEGDEAPTVVVLNDSKHLARDEVDRLRAQGQQIISNGCEPFDRTDLSILISSYS